jgi:vancomycin resistance protein YoaR
VFVGVFAIDAGLHHDRVARNVTIDGVHVGGLDYAALDRFIDALAEEASVRPLRIDGGHRSIDATLADVGVRLDTDALRAAVRRAGWDGSFSDDLLVWWSSFSTPRNIELSFVADPDIAEGFIAARPETYPYAPVEPTYTGSSGALVVTPGADGLALDPATAARAVGALAGAGYPPATVAVDWEPVPPRIDGDALEASLVAADTMARDLDVWVNGRRGTIGRGTVVRWIDSELTDAGLIPRFDYERAEASVERLLAGFVDPGTPPVFTVVDGRVDAELGEEPMRCCEPGFGADLEQTAIHGVPTIVRLPPTPVYADAGRAAVEAMGIEEQVGAFTTYHACCVSRVDNIQNIADLIRGVVIQPGESFSINQFVGQRTREKGFVAAGVIESGHFVDDVGGGISQFATTLFNASFLAGLDFETYQSHTIYISRYPYGREATLSWPAPDLVITNPTPHAMLIWTDYTDISITVEIYSTPHFTVEQTSQNTFRWGKSCRRVNTYRSRTAPDGEVIEDFVYATYRPGEGLDCNGKATPRPNL